MYYYRLRIDFYRSRESTRHNPHTKYQPLDLFGNTPQELLRTLDHPSRRQAAAQQHLKDLRSFDYRIGTLKIDWYAMEETDSPEFTGEPPRVNTSPSAPNVADPQNHAPTLPLYRKASQANGPQTRTKNPVPTPVGHFVPTKIGSTSLDIGVLRLYRDVKEISFSTEESQAAVEGSAGSHEAQESLGNVLSVLAVPSYMTPMDFVGFVGSYKKDVSHFRIIRDSSPNKFLVLLKFREAEMAREFYKEFNGRAFNSMEPEICHVVYIKSIDYRSVTIPSYAFPTSHDMNPGSGAPESASGNQILSMVELPTCPVCLERMDASVSGLLTILCQHTFHCHCLSKWQDGSCPVCRYSQKTVDQGEETNRCSECGNNEDLWICLICGNIGCGRYRDAHAHNHYLETSHLYSLELETQRVWDYAGDGYVHRLIQNKSDGKLVELPGPVGQIESGNISRNPISQDKLDSIDMEYSSLLSSQLESQRNFYEGQLDTLTQQITALATQLNSITNQFNVLRGEFETQAELRRTLQENDIPHLVREKRNSEKKQEKLSEKLGKLETEWKEEKEMNAALRENQEQLIRQSAEKDRTIADLQEQVRDLMFFLDTQQKIQQSPELAEGTLLIEPNPNPNPNPGPADKGKKGRRRR
ncbi:zf-UBP-domain-containing protein [Basidiobolus meristosporus CBS 931.73]|uniref:Zf-UBP-domain-containing protein n=1 Tax=Basidiobolus meristosporus CBS 931.73 TaxID=1314790 RepID=A0A1Y1XSJ9_9FUNG|nr:zf-UBP-domain-containing protein [Basidiobolus meristosporus CBS 931.73]|eukprot:ORX88710.1 zf-UBP-domain-containing protein [Basidiobolus meristosporus CBS 931.73]